MQQLNSPNSQPVELFLLDYDRKPRVLPRWPASSKLALVCVVALKSDPQAITRGFVMDDPADVQELQEHRVIIGKTWSVLFFTVVKSRLVEHCAPVDVPPWATPGV